MIINRYPDLERLRSGNAVGHQRSGRLGEERRVGERSSQSRCGERGSQNGRGEDGCSENGRGLLDDDLVGVLSGSHDALEDVLLLTDGDGVGQLTVYHGLNLVDLATDDSLLDDGSHLHNASTVGGGSLGHVLLDVVDDGLIDLTVDDGLDLKNAIGPDGLDDLSGLDDGLGGHGGRDLAHLHRLLEGLDLLNLLDLLKADGDERRRDDALAAALAYSVVVSALDLASCDGRGVDGEEALLLERKSLLNAKRHLLENGKALLERETLLEGKALLNGVKALLEREALLLGDEALGKHALRRERQVHVLGVERLVVDVGVVSLEHDGNC